MSGNTPVSQACSVIVNGAVLQVTPGITVAELLHVLGRRGEGIAIALNDEVVTRSRWADTELRKGDRVEVLTAAQGG